jgi:hypothetical protein
MTRGKKNLLISFSLAVSSTEADWYRINVIETRHLREYRVLRRVRRIGLLFPFFFFLPFPPFLFFLRHISNERIRDYARAYPNGRFSVVSAPDTDNQAM